MKISLNCGMVHHFPNVFYVDEDSAIILPTMILKAIRAIGKISEIIEAILIGPLCERDRPCAISVKLILVETGEKFEKQVVFHPAFDLDPALSEQQKQEIVTAKLRDAFSEMLQVRASELLIRQRKMERFQTHVILTEFAH